MTTNNSLLINAMDQTQHINDILHGQRFAHFAIALQVCPRQKVQN